MASQIPPARKVTRLDDYRQPHLRARQQELKDHILELAARSSEDAPTAMLGISVLPSGTMEAVIINVEPEHVIPALSAMRGLMTKMEDYLTAAITSRSLAFGAIATTLLMLDAYGGPALAALLVP